MPMLGRKQTSKYTYIVGDATGAETDPMSLEEALQHVKGGEITGATFVKRSDQEHWGTAADYPELGTKDTALSPMEKASGGTMQTEKVDPLAAEMELAAFAKPIRNGGNWFFWVAALTLINTIAVTMGSEWGFALGLQLTYFIGLTADIWGAYGKWIALTGNVLLVAAFIWFGIAGYSRQYVPYFIGVFLYAGDCILSLFSFHIFTIVLHFVALYYMGSGLKAFMDAGERKWLPALLKGAMVTAMVAGGGIALAGVMVAKQAFAGLDDVVEPDVYVHNAEFDGYSPLTNGFSMLVKLPSGKVVAVTDTLSLMSAKKDGKSLVSREVAATFKKWIIELDYDRDTKLEVAGLLTTNITAGIDFGAGIMALTLKTAPDFEELEDPLEIRTEPPVEGEELLLLIPSWADGIYEFDYYKATFGSLHPKGLVGVQLSEWVDDNLLEGSIVLDKAGKLVGLVPKTNLDKKGKVPGIVAMSLDHLKDL